MSEKPGLLRPGLVPRAWACFAESGNCIIWSTKMETVKGSADFYGRPVIPLYVALVDLEPNRRAEGPGSDATTNTTNQ